MFVFLRATKYEAKVTKRLTSATIFHGEIVSAGAMPEAGIFGVGTTTVSDATIGAVSTVTTGVEIIVGTGVGVVVGTETVKGVGVGEEVGVGVEVGAGGVAGTGVGVTMQVALVIVFESNVTAPLRTNTRPSTVAPVVSVAEVKAKILPLKFELIPSVAELPTCQKTLQACAPFKRFTTLNPAVVSVVADLKINIAFGSP